MTATRDARPRGDRRPATSDQRPATGDRRPATGDDEGMTPLLRVLDALIRAEGPFVAHSSRTLVEARRTGTP